MVIACGDRMAVRAMHRFSEEYQRKHCPVGKDIDPEKKENEIWRRITGITEAIENCMDAKERRAGIRDLVEWIEERVSKYRRENRAVHDRGRAGVFGVAGATPIAELSGPPIHKNTGLEVWACEGQSREMLEVVCRELNITKFKLGELAREFRGIGARELIDGLMVRGVKSGIGERLKAGARTLWGYPGNHVNAMVNDERLNVHAYGRSEFYVTASDNFYRGEVAETIHARRELLLEEFDGLWKRGGMSRDAFAMGLGFRNFSELNRACLNVFGKSVRDLAWDVSYAIVEFYVAKELETLRELALMEPANERVARARYLCFKDTKRPESSVVNWVWAGLDLQRRDELEAWLGTG